jgi:hypothetical protein
LHQEPAVCCSSAALFAQPPPLPINKPANKLTKLINQAPEQTAEERKKTTRATPATRNRNTRRVYTIR